MTETTRMLLTVLTEDYGFGLADLATATGAPQSQLRRARQGEGAALDVVAAGRLAELVRVLEAAHAATGEERCALTGRLAARIDTALAPSLLDVFADGRSDLALAALTKSLVGVDLLDAWRPNWRRVLDVSSFVAVRAGDGLPSLVPRTAAEVRADRTRLGICV